MYYIYSHTRLDKNEIFYIGKGTKANKGNVYKRAFTKNSRNIFWKRIVNKTTYKVDILKEFENEQDCLKYETELIQLYGRRINKTGILCNIVESDEEIYNLGLIALRDSIESRQIKTCQYDINGNFIAEYNSITEAAKETNIMLCDIAMALKGTRYVIGGFQWRTFKIDKIEAFNKLESYKTKNIIYQYNLNGEFLKEWKNISQAARILNLSRSSIGNCLCEISKSAGGFIWKYEPANKSRNNIPKVSNDASKCIIQYDLNMNFIQEYDSIENASKQTKLGKTLISAYLRKRLICKKFIFKYKDEELNIKYEERKQLKEARNNV